MKRLIYQVKLGNSKLYDHCVDSVAQYCEDHGIDHIVQTDMLLNIKPDPLTTNRSDASWNKFDGLVIYEKENAFAFLHMYDQIAIIDADIWIRPNSPNIFNYISPEADFAGVVERTMPVTPEYGRKIKQYSQMQYGTLTNVDWNLSHPLGGQFFNMGMMVIDKSILPFLNGNTPREFIMRPDFKRFVDGEGAWKWSTDQTLLNYWVRTAGMKFQLLDWKWNGLFKGIEDEAIEQCHFVHFFLKDKLPNRGENFEELMKNIGNIGGHE